MAGETFPANGTSRTSNIDLSKVSHEGTSRRNPYIAGDANGRALSGAVSLERKSHHLPTEKQPQLAETNPETNSSLVSFVDDGKFSFLLVVDGLGRALLSTKPESDSSSSGVRSRPELGPPAPETQPKLVHAHTAIGIEAMHIQRTESLGHKRKTSDPRVTFTPIAGMPSEGSDLLDKYIVPQTPKGRDDFYVGYTPKYDLNDGALAYNLTPQFNSMMYSMMSINSPQQKKGSAPSSTFMTMAQDSLDSPPFPRVNGSLDSSIDTELLGPGGRNNVQAGLASQGSNVSSPGDDGDARAALKKVFQLKRDV